MGRFPRRVPVARSGRRAPERGGEERGLRPPARRAFGCVTWMYMGILALLGAATLFALPLRYVGDGAGFGQVLSRISLFWLAMIFPGIPLAAVLGYRTYRAPRSQSLRVGTAIGAIFGWTSFLTLAWAAAAFGLADRDQVFRDGLFDGLAGNTAVLVALPVLSLASTVLVLYALYAKGMDFGRRRRLVLVGAALALLAGLVLLVADPDPLGMLGLVVSTLSVAIGGLVAGFGYARAGGDEMLPPGAVPAPKRQRRRRPR